MSNGCRAIMIAGLFALSTAVGGLAATTPSLARGGPNGGGGNGGGGNGGGPTPMITAKNPGRPPVRVRPREVRRDGCSRTLIALIYGAPPCSVD